MAVKVKVKVMAISFIKGRGRLDNFFLSLPRAVFFLSLSFLPFFLALEKVDVLYIDDRS